MDTVSHSVMWTPLSTLGQFTAPPDTAPGTVLANVCTCAVVPPGYYLKSPGVAAPCPQGEWKSGTDSTGSCTKCPVGVTTPDVASTSNASCSGKLHRPCTG
jgi:hypothetical protein